MSAAAAATITTTPATAQALEASCSGGQGCRRVCTVYTTCTRGYTVYKIYRRVGVSGEETSTGYTVLGDIRRAEHRRAQDISGELGTGGHRIYQASRVQASTGYSVSTASRYGCASSPISPVSPMSPVSFYGGLYRLVCGMLSSECIRASHAKQCTS
jgi:hypothetical protein